MESQNKKIQIPLMKPEDIEIRIGQVDKNGKWLTLLLYKNARIDMQILDDVFGPYGWTRSHREIKGNLFCTVSIWDDEKKQWVSKEDVGTESNTEAVKGEASDSFKRCCVNVGGIGRELYSAPSIFLSPPAVDIKEKNGKFVCNDTFVVTEIEYTNDRKIKRLVIAKEKYNSRTKVFEWEKLSSAQDPTVETPTPEEEKRKKELLYGLDFQFIELATLQDKDVDYIRDTVKKRFNMTGDFDSLSADNLKIVYDKTVEWIKKLHENSSKN